MGTREVLKHKENGAKEMEKAVITRGMIAFHYIVLVALFLCCWFIFYREPAEQGEYFMHDRTICASYVILLVVFSRVYNAYKVGLYRVGELVHSQFFANLMTWGITYFLACIMAQRLLNPLMGIVCLGIQSGISEIAYRFSSGLYLHKKDDWILLIKGVRALREVSLMLKMFPPDMYMAEGNN